MKRYIYQDDFKERSVILFRQVGIAKASKVTHVTRATLYRWNKEFGDDLQLPEGKDQWPELSENETVADQSSKEELRQLRDQIIIQKGVNRKLKKALLLILSDEE